MNTLSETFPIDAEKYKVTKTFHSNGDMRFEVAGDITFSSTLYGEVTLSQIINAITCLIEGTLITMSDGSTKPIENVKPGDIVKSYNPNNGQLVDAVVVANPQTGESSRFKTQAFSDGKYMITYGWHGVYRADAKYGYIQDIGNRDHPSNNHDIVGFETLNEDLESVEYCGYSFMNYPTPKKRYALYTSNAFYFANGILCGGESTQLLDYFITKNIPFSTELQTMKEEIYSILRDNQYLVDHDYLSRTLVIKYNIRKAQHIIDVNKDALAESDYINHKHQQGQISDEEYEEFTASCEEKRRLINRAQDQIEVLKAEFNAANEEFGIVNNADNLKPRKLQCYQILVDHFNDFRNWIIVRNSEGRRHD